MLLLVAWGMSPPSKIVHSALIKKRIYKNQTVISEGLPLKRLSQVWPVDTWPAVAGALAHLGVQTTGVWGTGSLSHLRVQSKIGRVVDVWLALDWSWIGYGWHWVGYVQSALSVWRVECALPRSTSDATHWHVCDGTMGAHSDWCMAAPMHHNTAVIHCFLKYDYLSTRLVRFLMCLFCCDFIG